VNTQGQAPDPSDQTLSLPPPHKSPQSRLSFLYATAQLNHKSSATHETRVKTIQKPSIQSRVNLKSIEKGITSGNTFFFFSVSCLQKIRIVKTCYAAF